MVAALPAAKFEDEAVKLMKGLGYPGNLSKSTFVSIGSQHAWPAVLGCITFLCDLARLLTVSLTEFIIILSRHVERLETDFIAIGFPGLDEDGLPTNKESTEKLKYELYITMWLEFCNNKDIFDEQIEDFKGNLMENLEVDINHLKALDQHKKSLYEEYER